MTTIPAPISPITYRERRKAIGTQQEVAVLLGVTVQTLSRREQPGAKITPEMLLALKALAAGKNA
jgi:DNA-binding XRE family transcriptional regulator